MVVRENPPNRPPLSGLIAGVDVSCPSAFPVAVAAVVVMERRTMEVVERRAAVAPLRFPYVPGFLSFREGEAVVAALSQVEADVGCVMFDGQGICHPRRLGLASHMGVLLDRPSLGCAKSLLLGRHGDPSLRRGGRRRIRDRGETVGTALRTRQGVKPVFVSIGHLIDLETAARTVLSACRRYRLPEPQREAHRLVTRLGKEPSLLRPFSRGGAGTPITGFQSWN
jgi:deoxyribonuclease V